MYIPRQVNQIILDRGEIFVSGHDIVTSQAEAFQLTGYCPQHNPLYDDLSVMAGTGRTV